MKKKFSVLIPVILLMFTCALFFHDFTEPVHSPVSKDQVTSVSIYYFNLNSKKEVTAHEDISAILSALSQSRSHGPYDRIPAGGQSFCMLFHLEDGSSLPCVYCQTAETSGYYTDGSINVLVPSLDLREVWDSLNCEAVQASAEREFNGWPSLTL